MRQRVSEGASDWHVPISCQDHLQKWGQMGVFGRHKERPDQCRNVALIRPFRWSG